MRAYMHRYIRKSYMKTYAQATPFYLVALSERAGLPLEADFEGVVEGMSEETFAEVEADCFWCMTLLLVLLLACLGSLTP
jgi:hypothetical protein